MLVTKRTYRVYSLELSEDEYRCLGQVLFHVQRPQLLPDDVKQAGEELYRKFVLSQPVEAR